MKKLIAAAFLIALPAAAHAMNVATFLEKAERLERRGAMALLSSDYRLLRDEVTGAGQALRAERLAAQQAGRRPAYCPPEGAGGVSPREILDHFRAMPPAQRARTEVRDGMRSLFARKWPCPA